jgi:hypothetical protein
MIERAYSKSTGADLANASHILNINCPVGTIGFLDQLWNLHSILRLMWQQACDFWVVRLAESERVYVSERASEWVGE